MSQHRHAVGRSPRWAWLAACALFVALAAFALLWIGRASAEKGGANRPAAVSKSVSTLVSKADAVDAIDQHCTTSLQFTDMPGMLVSFKLGGRASRAVIVLFQGRWRVVNTGQAAIRLTIDGVVQSGPGPTVDERESNEPEHVDTHGFNFVSDPVAPGLHVARIQWAAFPGLNQVCVLERSLIVLHK